MEQQLYQTALLVSGILCLLMGGVLLKYFSYFGVYPHYRRLRLLVAAAFFLIGSGCLLRWHLGYLPCFTIILLLFAGLGVLIAIFYNLYEYGFRLDKYDGTPRTEL